MMNSICKAPAAWNPVSSVSGTYLVNSTAQNQTFDGLLGNFERMLRAKAYLHWYTAEGMDIQEFKEAGHNLKDLISEYQQYQDASADDGADGYDEEMEDMEEAIAVNHAPSKGLLKVEDKQGPLSTSRSRASTRAGSDLGGSL